MAGNLLLGRKAKETVVIYAGKERIVVETKLRTTLSVKADPSVRIVRGELDEKPQAEEAK